MKQNNRTVFFMGRFVKIILLFLTPFFASSQISYLDQKEIKKNESLQWEAIDAHLKQYSFIILYVGDESEFYDQKVDFIKKQLDVKANVPLVMVRPERREGGDDKRKILGDDLTINSCYLITTMKSYLVGSFDYLEEKNSTKTGVYVYKFMKNRCVVKQLDEFEGFFSFGDGKSAIDNFKRNSEVIELHEEENTQNNQSKRDSANVESVVNGVGGYIGKIFTKSTAVCINGSSIYWKPYQRNFADGTGATSNSISTNLMFMKKIYFGDIHDTILRPTLNFGIGYSLGKASVLLSRERSLLGLLNGEDRYPVLINNEVQARMKSQALLFPLEIGMEWNLKSGKNKLSLFSSLGFWASLQQLSIQDLKDKSSDVFIVDSNSGLEIRDVNVTNVYSQALSSDENGFSFKTFVNVKMGFSYMSKRFSYSISYGLFKSLLKDNIIGNTLPLSSSHMKFFNESFKLGNAIGFGISYRL